MFSCRSFAHLNVPNTGFIGGDLDIPGTKLTVEAVINPTGPYLNSTVKYQDIVSKHHAPEDVNYLLRMGHAEITTSTGFYETDELCPLSFGMTYHIAMVYDGAYLYFYRNGSLSSRIPCTGNMVLNSWPLTLGAFAAQDFDGVISTKENETFNGYINEVRIWNVARTQQQLNEYKDKALPNPTSQEGLLAYYQFNDLKNKQGNSAYDLTLLGNPTINQSVPSCELAKDPCPKCNLSASFTATADPCNPAQFQFDNKTIDATSYTWNFGTETGAGSSVENPSFTYTKEGAYNVSLQVADDQGCSANTTQTVTAKVLPPAIATLPAAICKGASIPLRSSVEGADVQYAWSPAEMLSDAEGQSPIATLDQTTEFQLLVKKANGCEQKGSVVISVLPSADFKVSSSVAICPAHSTTLEASGGDIYTWFTSNGEQIGNTARLTVQPMQTEQYQVMITSSQCNEQRTLSSVVTVYPEPEVEIKQSHAISCSNTSAEIMVNGASNVTWLAAEGLVAKDGEAIVTPHHTTTYRFEFSDGNGCTYDSSVIVPVHYITDGTYITIPTAFTPNGDGRNDLFRILTNVALSRYELKIYNRYGQLLFLSRDPRKGWNGRFNGQVQPTGSYIFDVVAESADCGELHKKGTLVLIN